MKKIMFILRTVHLLPFYYLYAFIFNAHKTVRERYIKFKFEIHPSVKFWYNTHIYGAGRIIIGQDTYFGQNTFINSAPKDAVLKIGKRCSISHDVHIRTADNNPSTLNDRVVEKTSANVVIGDNCWIGKGVFIKGGVKIGNNVTIGANCVVTKSFPDNVVIAGIPAKIIKVLKPV